jgi:death-on-curing protein
VVEYLDAEDLIHIAGSACGSTQELPDLGLLASAAARPQATVGGQNAYPTLPDQAAALLHALTRHHPLICGNERPAPAATGVFLAIDGYRLVATQEYAVELVTAPWPGAARRPEIEAWTERRHT